MTSVRTILNHKTISGWLSTESLTRKALLNALAAIFDYGARLAVGFVITPILVVGLGDYGYGLWQILGRLIGYISPASGRSTQALKWKLASQQASTDFEEKRRHVGSAIAVWLLFLPLLLVLGGLVTWFTPFWFDVPADLTLSVRLATGLLVANLIMISLAEVPRSALEGENLGYRRLGLTATLPFVSGGLMILALKLDSGLVGVAAATLVATLLTGALFFQVARGAIHWFGIAQPALSAMREFWALSGWFLAWNLVMKLMRASDVLLLGMFSSVAMVTVYTLTKYLPETLINVIASVVFGISPGLGGIIGRRDLQKAARVRGEIMLVTWLIVTIAGTTILLWNRSFIYLWVGPEYYAGMMATMLIIAMVAQFVLIRNDANILDLSLDLRTKVPLGLTSAVLSMIIAGLLIGVLDMGISGLCVGFIAGRSVLSLAYPWLVGRFLGIPHYSQLKSAFRPFLVCVVLFGAASGLVNSLMVSTWFALFLAVGGTVVLVSFLAFFVGLTSEQRSQMEQRVRYVTQSAAGN